ncbi:MAG TPA: oxygenase MpaB family protein [Baekduia sp.]|nr:oxygenase MpaB family protein [Baekduia sp.]
MLADTIDVPLPFPRDSALRLVGRENLVQLGGFRALMLQALSPAMTAGFLEHTDMFDSRAHTLRRLERTRLTLNRIYFHEDAGEIQRMMAGVRAGHAQVRGTLPDGTPYAADDPEHLLWTLATTADSAWCWYREFVADDRDLGEAFWRDMRIMGRLFGLEEDQMPADWAGVHALIEDRRRDGSLQLSDRARSIALDGLRRPHLPPPANVLGPLVGVATVATLPAWVRARYGVHWPAPLAAAWAAGRVQRRLTTVATPARMRFAPEWFGVFPPLPPFAGTPDPVPAAPLPLRAGHVPVSAALRILAPAA